MIKKYYQKVKLLNQTEIEVLDFHKIRKNNCHINIILSERGTQGKTFNAKEYILTRWEKYQEKGVWLVNTTSQLQNLASRFIANHIETNPKWVNYKITGKGVHCTKTKETIIYFSSISTYYNYKGGRDKAVGTIVYDEFNEHIDYIWNKQLPAFSSLIHTFSNPHGKNTTRIFLLANTKSLAVPILHGLGIRHLQGEETFAEYESLKLWFYTPQKTAIQMEKMKKQWLFSMDKLFQLHESNYLNINRIDNFDGVNSDFDYDNNPLLFYITLNWQYYGVWKDLNNNGIHFSKVSECEGNKEIGWFLRHDKDYGRYYYDNFEKKVDWWLTIKKISFHDLMTKIEVISLGRPLQRDA